MTTHSIHTYKSVKSNNGHVRPPETTTHERTQTVDCERFQINTIKIFRKKHNIEFASVLISNFMLMLFIYLAMVVLPITVHAEDNPPIIHRDMKAYIHPDNPNIIKDVRDPFELVNRRMYMFNALLDKVVYLPVLRTYQMILPDAAEKCVSNFYNNIGEVFTLINAALQLKKGKTMATFNRILMNSTAGILGLFDVATLYGIPREHEDLGQTLGFYGVQPGPYLMLPILGPSNLRDALGGGAESLVFSAVDPFNFGENTTASVLYNTVKVVDSRNQVFFRYYMTGSPFEYEMVRMLYDRSRIVEIDN